MELHFKCRSDIQLETLDQDELYRYQYLKLAISNRSVAARNFIIKVTLSGIR